MAKITQRTETIDPQNMPLAATGPSVARPTAVVLFHSDLTRIGARTPAELLADGRPVELGRHGPDFVGPGDRPSGPIADPCVSRDQLSLRWNAQAWRFEIERSPGGRRSVRCLTPDFKALADADPIPPGGYVVVGDRLLLYLTLRKPPNGLDTTLDIIGESAGTQTLCERVTRVASIDRPVLVHGETGVGKERVAHAIHAVSDRSNGPFKIVNCASIPEHLFESELFGHRRGAFTGATADHEGMFRAAEGGTLFLDEVGELPLVLQAKMLRAVQERRVKAVGEVEERAVDVRIVAATNRDLTALVEASRFRSDLLFRLNTLQLNVPPLRLRPDDIPRLFVHFLDSEARSSEPLRRLWRSADARPPPLPLSLFLALLRWSWPGNVRELINLVFETIAENLHEGPFTLPPWAGLAEDPTAPATPVPTEPDKPTSQGRPDEAVLIAALESHDFKQEHTARALCISRSTLHRWMRELGVRRPRDVTAADIDAARASGVEDLAELAAYLKISPRGLQLRLSTLGIDVG